MDIKIYILQAVWGIIGLLLGFLTMAGCLYLKQKLREANDAIQLPENFLVEKLFKSVSDAISLTAAATVGKLEQVFGQEIRERIKSGKGTKEELHALADQAYREVLTNLSSTTINCLKYFIDDAEPYIRDIIETELLKLKADLSK